MTDAGELEALVSQQIVIAMKAHDAERTQTLRLTPPRRAPSGCR